MKSPYEKLNYFYLHDIPFLPLTTRGNAVNCRIGLSRQLVFIPKKYFDVTIDDITLKEGMDLEWFYNKRDTQNKINRNYKINFDNFDNYFADLPYKPIATNKDIIFKEKMNERYLKQCLYNLQEKYDCGGISQEEWQKIEDKFGGVM